MWRARTPLLFGYFPFRRQPILSTAHPSSSHPATVCIVHTTLLVSSHRTRLQTKVSRLLRLRYRRRRTRQHLHPLYGLPYSRTFRRSPPQPTFKVPSEVHFVMAPTITVRLARGLWTHPTNLGIALRAMGECADWAERVFAGTNADVDSYIWSVLLLHASTRSQYAT